MTKAQALAEAKRRWPELADRLVASTIPYGKGARPRKAILTRNDWSDRSFNSLGGGETWEEALQRAEVTITGTVAQ